MASQLDPYQVLGVSRQATDAEIRQAYRALVKQYHPDQYADPTMKGLAQDKLVEINQANDLIGDPEKRRQFDQAQRWGVPPHQQGRQDQNPYGPFGPFGPFGPYSQGGQQRGPGGGQQQGPFGQNPYQRNPYGQPGTRNPWGGSPYYGGGGAGCCDQLACLCCADSCCECFGGDLCSCC